jgi:hypothetical protein
MLPNTSIAIVTLAMIGLASPTGASARGGGGGTEVAAFPAEAAFTRPDLASAGADSAGAGFGFLGPNVYGDYHYYYGDYDESGCSLVARQILSRYGWRSRRVQVCD